MNICDQRKKGRGREEDSKGRIEEEMVEDIGKRRKRIGREEEREEEEEKRV